MAREKNLRNKGRALLLLLAAVLLLPSCDGSLVHSYRSTGGVWHKGDTILFFDSLLYETTSPIGLFAEVRCSAAYPYKDLWLQVEVLSADSAYLFLRDTVCCAIYDNDGRQNGVTAGILYQSEHYAASLKIPSYTPFEVRFTHLMNDTLLHGIYDVGIRLGPPCRHLSAGK